MVPQARGDNVAAASPGAGERPFYRKPWKIIPPIGALLGVIIASFTVWRLVFPPTPAPSSSIEYVIDTSAAMQKKFGKVTRFVAAKENILDRVGNYSSSQTALRLAGGDGCSLPATPDVGFHDNNTENFKRTLARVHVHGTSDWIDALNAAAGDLGRSLSEGGITTLNVYVGSIPTCSPPSSREGDISDALDVLSRHSNAHVRLNLYGVKAPSETKHLLRYTQRQATQTYGLPPPTYVPVQPCRHQLGYGC
jgi:hypothetical protein